MHRHHHHHLAKAQALTVNLATGDWPPLKTRNHRVRTPMKSAMVTASTPLGQTPNHGDRALVKNIFANIRNRIVTPRCDARLPLRP